jgi:hypothetical protein
MLGDAMRIVLCSWELVEVRELSTPRARAQEQQELLIPINLLTLLKLLSMYRDVT